MSTSLETVRERLPRPPSEIEAALGLPGGSFDFRGLKIPDGAEIDIDEWTVFGHTLCFMREWTSWSVGDWLVWGERIYGDAEASSVVDSDPQDRYNVASRITGLETTTLMDYASQCSRIPLENRRVELNFGVHKPVMALSSEEQVYWLDQAVINGWRREDLRDAIKEAKAPPKDGEQTVEDPPDPPQTIAQKIEQAARLAVNTAQPTDEGGALIPADPWHRLLQALGEE
jgi:hypothetical protein